MITADEQRRQGKGGLEGIGDGVGLDHVADEPERDDDGDGEKGRQFFTAEAL